MKRNRNFIIVICCLVTILGGFAIKFSYDKKVAEKEEFNYEYDYDDEQEDEQILNSQIAQGEISDSQKDILIGATQTAIEDFDYTDDTSYKRSDWKFFIGNRDDSDIWGAVTQNTDLIRVKAMYEWTGEDKNDLILIYLLINGKELINEL